MKKKYSGTKFFVFFLLILFFFIALIKLNQRSSFDIRSRASVEDDKNYCVNPPECCARMDQSHDAHECEWPIRGYCRNCGSIEGKNERCGWYWIFHNANDNEYKLGTNSPDGYGCMIGDEGNMRPKYNADGSINTLQPTAKPTAIPTQKPTSIPPTPTPVKPGNISQTTSKTTSKTKVVNEDSFPTEPVQPKIINVFEPPTPTPPAFKINFRIPQIQVNLPKINQATKKPLGLFEYIFRTIVSYDKRLEKFINGTISGVIEKNLTK